MRTHPSTGLLVAAAAMAAMALTPGISRAQQKGMTQASSCKANVMPMEIKKGAAATRLSVTLSKPIGTITDFTAPPRSGVTLASAQDLSKLDMSHSHGTQATAIQMAAQGNRATLWLSTSDATAGTYRFTLDGSNGHCSGRLEVAAGGS